MIVSKKRLIMYVSVIYLMLAIGIIIAKANADIATGSLAEEITNTEVTDLRKTAEAKPEIAEIAKTYVLDQKIPAPLPVIKKAYEKNISQIIPNLQEYKINETKRIKASIGAGVQNRFQIKDKKIKEVIGQGFGYKIYSDESGNHVFITPIGLDGERIDLTFIYDNDKACDLTLLVKGVVSQSVVIEPKETSDPGKIEYGIRKRGKDQIVSHLLKIMIKDRKSKYDVEYLNKKLPNVELLHTEADMRLLEFVIDRRYGWARDNLKGLRLRIKNIKGKDILLDENEITKMFEDVKLVYIPKKLLPKGRETLAYIIRSDSRFGQNGEKE